MTDLDKRQYDLLKRLEWRMEDNGYYPTQRFCPICSGTQPNHQPDCELSSVLRTLYVREAYATAASGSIHKSQREEIDRIRREMDAQWSQTEKL